MGLALNPHGLLLSELNGIVGHPVGVQKVRKMVGGGRGVRHAESINKQITSPHRIVPQEEQEQGSLFMEVRAEQDIGRARSSQKIVNLMELHIH